MEFNDEFDFGFEDNGIETIEITDPIMDDGQDIQYETGEEFEPESQEPVTDYVTRLLSSKGIDRSKIQIVDENGNPTPIQIQSGEDNQIKGSTDGVTPCKSTVKLSLKSGSADLLEGLSSVANLRYNLHVTSATDGVALNKNQTISANILMEVDGNLNINLNE